MAGLPLFRLTALPDRDGIPHTCSGVRECQKNRLAEVDTVDSVITHTPPWTSQIMGFHRVWGPGEVIIGCLWRVVDVLYECKSYKN
jgi:hypothetical protein